MSYDLAVMSTDKPMTRDQAIEVFGRICDEEDTGDWLSPHDRIKRFITELTADYPQIDDVPEEKIDECPWNCAFDLGESWVIMAISWSRAQEMAKVIFNLTRKHGLALFDPKSELVYLPDTVVRTAGVTLTCPWLLGQMTASRELITDLVPFIDGKDDPYIVLEADDEVYMQTLWTNEGYLLEYRDGSARKHYRATSLVSKEAIIETLTDYALRGKKWPKMHKYSQAKF